MKAGFQTGDTDPAIGQSVSIMPRTEGSDNWRISREVFRKIQVSKEAGHPERPLAAKDRAV
jgi:hypothetical protein